MNVGSGHLLLFFLQKEQDRTFLVCFMFPHVLLWVAGRCFHSLITQPPTREIKTNKNLLGLQHQVSIFQFINGTSTELWLQRPNLFGLFHVSTCFDKCDGYLVQVVVNMVREESGGTLSSSYDWKTYFLFGLLSLTVEITSLNLSSNLPNKSSCTLSSAAN